MSTVTLAQLNINLGTRDELEALADDVGLELEDGMEDLALAEAIGATIDGKDDDEWAAMGEAAKAWSNRVNATKKAYKKRMTASKGKAGAEPNKDDWKSLTVAKLKAKAKELGVTRFGGMTKPKLIEAIDTRLAMAETPETKKETGDELGKEPTKAELEAMKKAAKEKADAVPPAKKQAVSEKPYKPDTTAWMITQCVKDAGKAGITAEEVLKGFEKRIKKAKATCTNPKGRVSIIIKQAIDPKGLATEKGGKYFPTAKLNKAE